MSELLLYGVVGSIFDDEEGFNSKTVRDFLDKLPEDTKAVQVRLYSPGGDVFEGQNIAAIFRQHRARVEVTIDGSALSAATIVAMGADIVRATDNSVLMIHRPYGWTVGDSDVHRKMAASLDKIQDTMVTTYRWHSHLSAQRLTQMMNETTWMDAEEAKTNGFVDEIVTGDSKFAAASLSARALKQVGKIPEKYRRMLENGKRQVAMSLADKRQQRREAEDRRSAAAFEAHMLSVRRKPREQIEKAAAAFLRYQRGGSAPTIDYREIYAVNYGKR